MTSKVIQYWLAALLVAALAAGCGSAPEAPDAAIHDAVVADIGHDGVIIDAGVDAGFDARDTAAADVAGQEVAADVPVEDVAAEDVAADVPVEDVGVDVAGQDVAADVALEDVIVDVVAETFVPDPPDIPPNPDCANPDVMVTVSGHITQAVAGSGQDLTGGIVRVVGHPEYSVTLGRSWAYSLQAPSCTEIILELDHPGLHKVHTGILYTGDDGLDEVTLQTPDHETFDLLLWFSQVEIIPGKCQLATTITDLEHLTDTPCHGCGEPGALAFLSPPVAPENGPIYFQIEENGIIYPFPDLDSTTEDGDCCSSTWSRANTWFTGTRKVT
jgi:hypothetical protein